jgi:hypothetical protein
MFFVSVADTLAVSMQLRGVSAPPQIQRGAGGIVEICFRNWRSFVLRRALALLQPVVHMLDMSCKLL